MIAEIRIAAINQSSKWVSFLKAFLMTARRNFYWTHRISAFSVENYCSTRVGGLRRHFMSNFTPPFPTPHYSVRIVYRIETGAIP